MVKKSCLFLAVLMIMGLLSGCNTFVAQEPKNPDDTLFIGQIIAEFDDGAKEEKDIKVTLENIKTNKEIEIDTNYRGIVYKYNLEPGTYELKKFYYEKTDEKMIHKITTSFSEVSIDIKKGCVTNFGSLKWIFDVEKTESEIEVNESPQEFKDTLLDLYPESEWFFKTWIDPDIMW